MKSTTIEYSRRQQRKTILFTLFTQIAVLYRNLSLDAPGIP